MKKIIALTLTGAVVFSTIFQDEIPVYALDNNAKSGIEIYSDALIDDSEQTELDAVGLNVESYEGSVVIDAASDEDADALLDGYINMLVSAEKNSEEDVAPEGVARGESLNPINRYLYDFLAEKASKVAEGSLSSTSFETGSIDLIPYYDGQYLFTKEELGVSNLNSQEAFNAALEKTGLDISKVSKALLADYPYELYWWDKVSGFSYSYAPMTNISGNKLSVESISYTFRMYVSADYSVGSGIKTTNVDTNKTGAASSTVDKAKKVVKDALDNGCTSDYKKLKFYKKYICDNTSYNYDALGKSTAFSNPWQLIYVFDEDPSTKVVCEGYSKAFKLLCDLSSFDYASLDCYLMSGLMSTTSHPTGENHMWNMVKMNDGKNYLVDVTNCDNDNGVSDDRLFLVGNGSSNASGFSISRPKLAISSTSYFPQDTVNYSYDSSTLATFTDTERRIAGANYDPATEPEPEPETKVVVTLDANGGTVGTDKVTVVYGAAYGTLPTPQNEGKSFDGWFTAKSGGSKVLSTTTVTNKNAHTLYAHWNSEADDPTEDEYRICDFKVDNIGYRFLEGENVALTNADAASGEYSVPSKVTYNGKAYKVTKIDAGAIYKNELITKLVLSDSIVELGDMVRTGKFLTDGTYGWEEYAPSIGECPNLREVVFNEGLEIIGNEAFRYCPKISGLNLPKSLREIHQCAFLGDTGLTSVNLPENVDVCHCLAFKECSNLSEITVSEGNKVYISYDGVLYTKNNCIFIYPCGKKDEIYAIKEGTKESVLELFAKNSYIRKVIIPQSFIQISSNFTKNSSVSEIEVDKNNTVYKSVDGVVCSKDGTMMLFYPAGKKDKIFFVPDGVKCFGEESEGLWDVFEYNPYIEEIYIPASVENLNVGFFNLVNLKKVVFAKNSKVKNIKQYMFQDDPSLESICFPSGINKIDNSFGNDSPMFSFCNSLNHIYFSKGSALYTESNELLSIGKSFFRNTPMPVIYGHGSNNKISEFADIAECRYVDVEKEEKLNVLGVTFDNTNIILNAGEEASVKATAYPLTAKEKLLSYTTSNKNIATVDDKGVVTAIAKGKCYITAEACDDSKEYARCQIEVLDGDKNVISGIELDNSKIDLQKGESATIIATVLPKSADARDIVWSSSDKNIVDVQADISNAVGNKINVILTAGNKQGTATVTARAGEVTASIEVTVGGQDIKGIKINESSPVLFEGDKKTLSVVVDPEDAKDIAVKWSSNNKKVAIVDEDGNVTAIGEGTAIISASVGELSDTVEVTVIVPVKFDKHEISLTSLPNSTDKITAIVQGKGYSTNSLIWSSSDEKIATVKNGVVTAADGLTVTATAVITAETTDHKYKDTCTVTVTPAGQARVPAASVKSGEVEEGTLIELSGESSDTRILYTVDGNVPAVDNDGNPIGTTMLYSGGIRITKDTVIKAIAVRDGCKNSPVAEFTYTVKQSSTVSDNVINVRLVVGGKVNNAELAKSKDDGKLYKINIADNKIASISNKGVIQGKKAGNTTATVIKKDKEYKLNITVVAAGFTKKSYTVNTGDVINPIFKSEGVEITSFVSNKPGIASVYPTTDGLYVVAKTKGSAKITAICDGKKYNVTVKVFDPYIAGTDILLIDNKTASLSVKNGTGKTTEWKSDNEAVLTVKNGKIKGVSKGSATITAINNGRTMEKKINVYKLPEFGQKLYETSVDKPIEVILTRDSDMGEPVYSVSNKKVATIDEKGILTPVKKGNVTVTALIGGKKYSTKVKIK